MAPESILRHAYSARSDSYAFGVAGWELLAGQAEPYAGVLPLEAAIRAAHDEAFRPEIAPQVPRPLAGLLRRCWAHQPERRPPFEKILNSLQRMERFLADKISRQHSATATAANGDDQQGPQLIRILGRPNAGRTIRGRQRQRGRRRLRRPAARTRTDPEGLCAPFCRRVDVARTQRTCYLAHPRARALQADCRSDFDRR